MAEQFLFPFSHIEKDAKIVLYGAGNVGRQFYDQILNSKYCNIVLWIDKESLYYGELGYCIFRPHRALCTEV